MQHVLSDTAVSTFSRRLRFVHILTEWLFHGFLRAVLSFLWVISFFLPVPDASAFRRKRGGKGWSKQNETELIEQDGWRRYYKTRVKRLWSSWSCWLFLPGFSPEKCGHHYLQITVLMLYSLGLTNPHIYAFQPQPDVKVHWFPHQW